MRSTEEIASARLSRGEIAAPRERTTTSAAVRASTTLARGLATWGEVLFFQQQGKFDTERSLWALAELADWPGQGRPLATVKHALTHFDWALTPCHWSLPGRLGAKQRQAIEASLPTGRWVARDAALTMGLPAPIRRLLEAGAPA